MSPTRSFEPTAAHTVTLPGGQIAHEAHAAHSAVLERRFSEVRPGVWSLVGNGLSNQSFIEGPDGIIAIDTGESIEEMRAALAELRAVTDRPVVAVLYTHFHYVGGTGAVIEADAAREVPIYGHTRIASNRSRASGEIGPTYLRGLVQQFAMALPPDGPDGIVNVGLGRFFRDLAHAPFTDAFLPPTVTFDTPTTLTVAGLEVQVTPAPSDADDSVTYWFPELGVAVNNLVWPVLFNVFAIRGEEYRDPRVMLTGLDHLLSLDAEHLVNAHGPAISGAAEIRARVTRSRDAIQFLWDQTVRHTNLGLAGADLAHAIRLPDQADDDYLTRELYGITEHHVRQIRTGLFGFFDGDEAGLFPLPRAEHAARMIDGFGGRDEVRRQTTAAIDGDDLRWAIELGTWLAYSPDAEAADRELLAQALRLVAQRTSAANLRSWCLTRALELDGAIDLSGRYQHRLSRRGVLGAPLAQSVHVLRVLLDPDRTVGLDLRLGWRFTDGTVTGLHLRNGIACPTDGTEVDATIECSPETWANLLSGQAMLSAAITNGELTVAGDTDAVTSALAAFDVDSLRN